MASSVSVNSDLLIQIDSQAITSHLQSDEAVKARPSDSEEESSCLQMLKSHFTTDSHQISDTKTHLSSDLLDYLELQEDFIKSHQQDLPMIEK